MTVENVNISGHIALVFNQEMFLLFLPESMGNKVAKFNERRLRNNQWTSLLFFFDLRYTISNGNFTAFSILF